MPLKELLDMGRRMEEKLDALTQRIDRHLGEEPEGVMTDIDLNLIVNSGNILEGIDRWNKGRAPKRRKRA